MQGITLLQAAEQSKEAEIEPQSGVEEPIISKNEVLDVEQTREGQSLQSQGAA